MAKADPTRDYYADLELSTAADLGEIKKQFRKLGACGERRASVGPVSGRPATKTDQMLISGSSRQSP